MTFAPGQIWKAKGRPDDGDSVRVLVLAVETHAKIGDVCSIAVEDVCIRNPLMDGGVQTALPHAPMSADALAASVTELIASNGPTIENSEYADAYAQWHEPFARGEAGVFTIAVAEILDLIEQTIATQH